MKENLAMVGIDDVFLGNILKKAKLENERQLLILTLDSNGKFFIQGKKQSGFKTFNINLKGGTNITWQKNG